MNEQIARTPVSLASLMTPSKTVSIDFPDIKNLVIHKENKKINYVEFLKSNSEKVSLEDFDSNLIIINFWATWCAPCVEEMPSLSLLKKKNEFKDIEIIPINIGNEKYQKSKKFFEELNIDNLEIFSGNSIITVFAEEIEAVLDDLGKSWIVKKAPKHKI